MALLPKSYNAEKAVKKPTMFGAILISILGTGLSRISGLLRDKGRAYVLGDSQANDIFGLAFLIPNIFRKFVADEGLSGAVIPELAEQENKEEAMLLAHKVFTILFLVNLIIISVFSFFPEVIIEAIQFISPSNKIMGSNEYSVLVNMTRWLFPFLLLVSIVSFYEALLNLHDHFFIPKIAPALVNSGIIIALLYIGFYQAQEINILSRLWVLVLGVLGGGVFHVLIHWPILLRKKIFPKFNFDFKHPSLPKISKEMGKVMVIGIFGQLNIIILRSLAFYLPEGSFSIYENGTRLVDIAQALIAVSIGGVLLPLISKVKNNKNSKEEVSEIFAHSLNLLFFALLPTLVFFAFFNNALGGIFGGGRFSESATILTGQLSFWLIPFILASANINLLKRLFFAFNERGYLIKVGAFGVVLTFFLGRYLVQNPLFGQSPLIGLAQALSLSTCLQFLFYFIKAQSFLTHDFIKQLGKKLMPLGIPLFLLVIFLYALQFLHVFPATGYTLKDWGMLLLICTTAPVFYLGVVYILAPNYIKQMLKR